MAREWFCQKSTRCPFEVPVFLYLKIRSRHSEAALDVSRPEQHEARWWAEEVKLGNIHV